MVNHCTFIGNLTRDPELRYTPAGAAVCNFAIACNERFKDKDGNAQERVEFVNTVAWNQLAEICGKYLEKGKQVYVSGKMRTRSYDDKDGNKRYITEIVADTMKMLGGRGEQGNGGERDTVGNSRSQDTGRGDYADPPFNPDDDIPF